jgi:5'-methylthioadenosine phosphorylase
VSPDPSPDPAADLAADLAADPAVASAEVAVIGGTGFYSFLDDAEQHAVETPYGEPSAPVSIGTVAGRRVAFLPRHGVHHDFPPHLVPYRANLWALRSLGVRQVIGPCAVGGLRSGADGGVTPGDLVVPDQLVDRTSGRPQTYVERGAVHLPFADPYCPRVSGALADAAPDVRRGGAMVVVEGPRFSTRAESRWFAEQGWTLVNMTGHPEAVLARELRMCYAALALVTDMDAGAESGTGVGQEEVFARFRENLERLTGLLTAAVAALPDPAGCTCSTWADGLELTYRVPGPPFPARRGG